MNTVAGVAQRHCFTFGTKAETLWRLKSFVTTAQIPELYFFSLKEWQYSKNTILDTIHEKMGVQALAIRSSALAEDCADSSMAGAFFSELNVDSSNRSALESAIDLVAQSMTNNPRDQILIQSMVDDVAVSGVIMTFDMVHGAPYYCIDFDDESGRTDVVTSGSGVHKSLFVYRHAARTMIKSTRVASFLRLARELEEICQCAALDIEFGMNKTGQLFLFQVRRIALSRNWHPVTERRAKRQLTFVEDFIRNSSKKRDGILGNNTIFAIMPDWNPAEIIGTTPRPLAASLYRELITKEVWGKARAAMEYRCLEDEELMVLINNHPYIDVRNSFNSFLPACLPDDIGEKLVNAWLARLKSYPEYHDKVEFDIVPTCIDFCFADDFKTRYPDLLNEEEFEIFKTALTELTRECLNPAPNNTLNHALEDAATLEKLLLPEIIESEAYAPLARANFLVTKCRKLGTLPFAIVARHAFIAEALLRSAVKRGAITGNRLTEFKRSICTVTGSMVEEYAEVCLGQSKFDKFLNKYGHLRPGTYEITSLR
ncbi:MAG: hypothetical protein OEM02_09425, partial [Desulfobulbaceae bacterium]|nr:hypothetical protein [Desulfobulbaceae bacterium]